ncbi:hypothetical protein ACQKND_04265 [Viridibacillus arvi]|uniref:hypothetical protein n=1 Tax=Viridibacillus arvi TaxID=263475 RepID=UPI003CFE1A5C
MWWVIAAIALLIDLITVCDKNRTGYKGVKLKVFNIVMKNDEYQLNQKTSLILTGVIRLFMKKDWVKNRFIERVEVDCKKINELLNGSEISELFMKTHSGMKEIMIKHLDIKVENPEEPVKGYSNLGWNNLYFRTRGRFKKRPENFHRCKITFKENVDKC